MRLFLNRPDFPELTLSGFHSRERAKTRLQGGLGLGGNSLASHAGSLYGANSAYSLPREITQFCAACDTSLMPVAMRLASFKSSHCNNAALPAPIRPRLLYRP